MTSQSRIWGARRKALSGIEGLLKIVGLEEMAEGVIVWVAMYSRRTFVLKLIFLQFLL